MRRYHPAFELRTPEQLACATPAEWALRLTGSLFETSSYSACCNPGSLKEYMALLEKNGHDTPPPERWAVWRLKPDAYDPDAADGAKGGVLYECRKSPPMVACDLEGHCYVPQDGVDTLMRIDATPAAASAGDAAASAGDAATAAGDAKRKLNHAEQLPVPFPLSSLPAARMTGPSIQTDPAGGIWYCLLGCNACLVRLDPRNGVQSLHQISAPAWAPKLCFIHLDIATDSVLGHRIYGRSARVHRVHCARPPACPAYGRSALASTVPARPPAPPRLTAPHP